MYILRMALASHVTHSAHAYVYVFPDWHLLIRHNSIYAHIHIIHRPLLHTSPTWYMHYAHLFNWYLLHTSLTRYMHICTSYQFGIVSHVTHSMHAYMHILLVDICFIRYSLDIYIHVYLVDCYLPHMSLTHVHMYIFLNWYLLHTSLTRCIHICNLIELVFAPYVTHSIYACLYISWTDTLLLTTHSIHAYMLHLYLIGICSTRHSLDICIYVYL